MPTLSGSVNFTQTRNEIATDALILLGSIQQGATPAAEVTT